MSSHSSSDEGGSLTGVIVAGALSAVLGVALCVAVMVLTPVPIVKAKPADAAPGAVVFISGTEERGRGSQWQGKERDFIAGSSVNVVEDELNLATAAQTKPDAAQPPLNFRIRDGVFQFGTPLTIPGLGETVIFQAQGGFARHGDRFVLDAREVYLGACPLHRLPGAAGLVMNRISASARANLPAEFQAAWSRLTSVSIEGDTLRLATQ